MRTELFMIHETESLGREMGEKQGRTLLPGLLRVTESLSPAVPRCVP